MPRRGKSDVRIAKSVSAYAFFNLFEIVGRIFSVNVPVVILFPDVGNPVDIVDDFHAQRFIRTADHTAAAAHAFVLVDAGFALVKPERAKSAFAKT